MAKRSFLDCPHNNVQDFTECCLDCGYNVYMSKEEYLESLKEDARRAGKDPETEEIRKYERKLGIR